MSRVMRRHCASNRNVSAWLRSSSAAVKRSAGVEWVDQQQQVTRALSSQLAASLPQIPERIEALRAELKARNAAVLASELAPATHRLCPDANQGNPPSSEFAGEQQTFHCLARDQIGRHAPNFPAHGLPLEYPDRFPAH